MNSPSQKRILNFNFYSSISKFKSLLSIKLKINQQEYTEAQYIINFMQYNT